jgi:prepilin signal peptidase PulO-like enzyme (type II secretory pathway)
MPAQAQMPMSRRGGGDSDTCTTSHRGKPLLFSLVYYFHWLRSQQPKVRSKKGAYLFAACLLTSMLPAKCWKKITEPNCLPP